MRGSVCVYQGEELGLTEAELDYEDLKDPFGITYYPEFRGRDGSRTPLPWCAGVGHAGFSAADKPWLPVPHDHHLLAVDVQERDPGSTLNAWKRFLAWRKTQPALVRGEMVRVPLPDPFLAVERVLGGERVLVVFNLSDQPARLALEPFGEARPLSGHGFGCALQHGAAVLPPYGAFFAALEPATVAARGRELETVG
jgi:alpha-glucosidase